MDKLNKNIIEILKSDGRIPNAEIARNLGVSEGTVRRRIKIMIEEKILNVYAAPDPKKTGYNEEALIGIQVDPNKLDQVGDSIAEHEYTTWVSRTTGGFDIFTWVTLPDSKELTNFLTYFLGNLDGVNKTETFISLDVLKRGL
jgi:Lrp/AsnC family transcriptional regulator for asnA, asnC and gidA